MPTASSDMIQQLFDHGKAAEKKISKMHLHLDKHPDSPSKKKIEDAGNLLSRVMPQVEKFQRDAQRNPPIFAEEGDYKKCRTLLTKIIGAIVKTEKAVSKEKFDDGDEVTEVQCVSAARSELLGSDAKLAQALIMVATGVKGRTGPKQKGVPRYNHIHIGGNAKYNLLFQPNNGLVLGTINFHIDKSNNDQQQEEVKAVATRSGSKTTLKVSGKRVTA